MNYDLLDAAVKAYEAMTPEQKASHDYEQRRSFVRGMCPWNRDYREWCILVDKLLPPSIVEPSEVSMIQTAINVERETIEKCAQVADKMADDARLLDGTDTIRGSYYRDVAIAIRMKTE